MEGEMQQAAGEKASRAFQKVILTLRAKGRLWLSFMLLLASLMLFLASSLLLWQAQQVKHSVEANVNSLCSEGRGGVVVCSYDDAARNAVFLMNNGSLVVPLSTPCCVCNKT